MSQDWPLTPALSPEGRGRSDAHRETHALSLQRFGCIAHSAAAVRNARCVSGTLAPTHHLRQPSPEIQITSFNNWVRITLAGIALSQIGANGSNAATASDKAARGSNNTGRMAYTFATTP